MSNCDSASGHIWRRGCQIGPMDLFIMDLRVWMLKFWPKLLTDAFKVDFGILIQNFRSVLTCNISYRYPYTCITKATESDILNEFQVLYLSVILREFWPWIFQLHILWKWYRRKGTLFLGSFSKQGDLQVIGHRWWLSQCGGKPRWSRCKSTFDCASRKTWLHGNGDEPFISSSFLCKQAFLRTLSNSV